MLRKGGGTKEVLLEEFRRCLEENAKNLQKYGVTAQYQEHLNEPSKEELPRLFELDVEDFYRGQLKLKEYKPLATFSRREYHGRGSKQLTMQGLFRKSFGTEAEQMMGEGTYNHVTMVGPAGSGKTTILTRFARDVLDGAIHGMQEEDRLVHVVDARNLDAEEEISVREFLFRNMTCKPSDEAIKVGYEWILENANKVTFVIDSLDTLGYDLDGQSGSVRPYSRGLPAKILYSMFTRKLFLGCRMLSSSREYKIRNYRGHLRADRIVSLGGLDRDAIKRLVFGFLGRERGEQVWEYLESKCLELLAMCETPLFLVFTMVSMGEEEVGSRFVPKTMTGVMINLLQSLVHSGHAHSLKGTILNKMKKLSYVGMMEGRVLFNNKHLQDAGLAVDEVTDLAIVVSRERQEYQRILEGGLISFFAHQSIEEVLCAFHIAQMEPEEFRSFVSKSLHDPHYSVVRRMLCGLLLDPEVAAEAEKGLLQDSKYASEMRHFLIESMKNQLNEVQRHDTLELVYAIREAGDGAKDIAAEHRERFDFPLVSLTKRDMFVLASVFRHFNLLKRLDLSCCNLTQESLSSFHDGFSNSFPQIEKLDVGYNLRMGASGLESLGRIILSCSIKDCSLINCDLSSDEITAFANAARGAKIQKLRVDQNSLGSRNLSSLVDLLENCEMQEVQMNNCGLTTKGILAFSRRLKSAKLKSLSLSFNEYIDETGWAALGDVVRKCRIEKFDMSECMIKPEGVDSFRRGLGNAKIKELSMHELYTPEETFLQSITAICRLIPNITECLDLRFWPLDGSSERLLQTELNRLHPTDLKIKIGYAGRMLSSEPKEWPRDKDSSTVERIYKKIDAGGGSVQLSNCTVTFPEDAFEDVTIVGLKSEIDSSKWPKGYLGVTPILYIEADKPLLRAATVELRAQFSQDILDESKHDTVDVLYLNDGDKECDVVTSLPFQCESPLRFDCTDLRPIVIGMRGHGSHFPPLATIFRVKCYVGWTSNYTLGFNFWLDDGKPDFEKPKSPNSKHLTLMPAKRGDRINVKFIRPEAGSFSFPIDESFIWSKEPITIPFWLGRCGLLTFSNKVKCNIMKNDETVHRCTFLYGSFDNLIGLKLRDSRGKTDRYMPIPPAVPISGSENRLPAADAGSTGHLDESSEGSSEDSSIVIADYAYERIDSSGGQIQLGGCIVTFPSDAFDDVTNVHVKLEIDSSKWPKGYLGIAPMLYVESDRPLLKAASIQMTAWCVNNMSEGSKNNTVDVLHLADEHRDWEVIASLPFRDEAILKFDCADFSPVLIGLPDDRCEDAYFIVESLLYATPTNTFTFAFWLRNETIKRQYFEMIRLKSATLILRFNPRPTKLGDKIAPTIACQPPGDVTFKPDKFFFLVDDTFTRWVKEVTFTSQIVSERSVTRRIQLECELTQNDEVVDQNRCFQYDWTSQAEVSKDSETTIHGNVTANNIFMGKSHGKISSKRCGTSVVGDASGAKAQKKEKSKSKALETESDEDKPSTSKEAGLERRSRCCVM